MFQTVSFQLCLNVDYFCYSFPLSELSNARNHAEQSWQKPMPCVCLIHRKYLEPISAADSVWAMTVLVQPTPCLELKPPKNHKYCIFARVVGTLVENKCSFSWIVCWWCWGKSAGLWRITWFPEEIQTGAFPERLGRWGIPLWTNRFYVLIKSFLNAGAFWLFNRWTLLVKTPPVKIQSFSVL